MQVQMVHLDQPVFRDLPDLRVCQGSRVLKDHKEIKALLVQQVQLVGLDLQDHLVPKDLLDLLVGEAVNSVHVIFVQNLCS